MGSEPRPHPDTTVASDALDALAAEVTPQVLEEAVAQAADRARAEIADRLARAIVERALAGSQTASPDEAEPASVSPAAASPSASSGASSGDTGSYAFAIIPARPVDLAGVAGIDGQAPLRIIEHRGLGLVVSEVELDLLEQVREDDLSETGVLATLARRHDEVVRNVFEHGPVLPLRFGTVVADEDGGRRLLEEQAVTARRRLDHLGTHREWGVRLRRLHRRPEEPDDTERGRRQEMSGTSYLASRRQALQESERAEREGTTLSRRVEDALREHAVDHVHRGGAPGSDLLADVAYLVPADREGSFLDAVDRLGRSFAPEGLTLDTTGPWPPYSFATLETEPSSAGQQGVVGRA